MPMADDAWDRGWAAPGNPGSPSMAGGGGWPQGGEPGGQGQAGWGQSGQPGSAPGWEQQPPPGQAPGHPGQAGWGQAGQAPPGQPAWPGQPGQPAWSGPYQPHPPFPPGRRRGPHPAILVVSAVALIAMVGVVAAFIVSGGDDGGGDEPSGQQSEAAASDAGLVMFDHPDGTYALGTPEGWAATPIEGDVTGIGAEVFPDEPAMADAFQRMIDSVPRNIVFVGADSEEIAAGSFVSNINVARLANAPTTDLDQLAGLARQEVAATGGQVTDEGRFTTAGGEALRVEYTIERMPGVAGIMYQVPVGGDVWGLAYTSNDLDAEEGLADAVAASFEPAG